MRHTRKLLRSQNLSFILGNDRQDKPINNAEFVGLNYIMKNEDYG